MKKSKPDYLDFDKDGDKTESMKKALKEKNAKKMMGGGEVKVDEVIRMPKEIQIPGMMGGGMMNYKHGGHAKKMMGGGMMNYKYGGQAKKMMGGGMMYKDGGDVQTVTQGHKGMKNTVKYK